ncbi:hypothetical protein HII17_15265 [Thalassotalea sp. M1531]|uniref:Flagellar hook-length control protein-like C-terminal domain-containing protein n=1 Tax=Thalassotalea algicola TaxID=2716224 RepID=A0A7Y0Q871_9GAMM|nr:flagellar hook-length control protein FliK [Thalassotalea algicola]NMP32916.1 hypothetical protein [Thalassotalea algicola]
MSQVKMLSIDLMQAADASGEPSNGEASSTGNEFAKHFDSKMNHNEAAGAKNKVSSDAQKQSDDAKQIKGDVEQSSNEPKERDAEAIAQSNEKLKEAKADDRNTENEELVDSSQQPAKQSEEQQQDNSKQLIELLAKSDKLLNSSEQQPAKSEASAQALKSTETQNFAKSPLSEIITKSMSKSTKEHVESEALTDDIHLSKTNSTKQSHNVLQSAQQVISKAGLNEELTIEENDVDALTDAEMLIAKLSEKLKQKEDLKQVGVKQQTQQSIEKVSGQNAIDEISSLEESDIALDGELVDTNLQKALQNQDKPDVKSATNKLVESQLSNKESKLASASNAINPNINSMGELDAQSEVIKSAEASGVLQTLNVNQSKLQASTVKQEASRINIATQEAVNASDHQMNEQHSDAEQDGNKKSDDNNASQFTQMVNNGNPVKANKNADSVAQTIAAMSNNKTENDTTSIDQKAMQQQLDAISSRVIESNQEFKKVQQVQQETINIYRKDFANAVKDKVMVMVSQKLQQVEIQLDPPELGNVHVRLNLQGEQAAVSFTVQNQQAKEALEQQMGKLRDMLQESGVDVGDANVAQQQQSNDDKASGNLGNQQMADADDTMLVEESLAHLVNHSATGVDFYA